MQVMFHDRGNDANMLFAVIVGRYQNTWLFCRHKQRDTYEIVGGHREGGESIEECARRELYEESGASDYSLYPVTVYSCLGKNIIKESSDEKPCYGMLYFAEIRAFEKLPEHEIASIAFFETAQSVPAWTYPDIQPYLLSRVQTFLDSFDKTSAE